MTPKPLPSVLLAIPIPVVGTILCCLPLFAALLCVVWSLVFDFERSTSTQCRVANYLPSVSAAIGDSTPQRYVWRICVCLHATPRLLLTLAYRELHRTLSVTDYLWLYELLVNFTALFNMVEIGSLITLSYISSSENYEIHEAMFVTFMVSGIIYMGLTILLFSWRNRFVTPSSQESKSSSWKRRLFALNISTFLVSIYLFFRHTWYCEPGMYTAFATCEYAVVLTNIGFHGTLIWDFERFSIACTRTNLPSEGFVQHKAKENKLS